MAAKTRELTAYGARKKKFLRRDFGDLKVQMGVRDVTSPIAVLGITDFGNNWEERAWDEPLVVDTVVNYYLRVYSCLRKMLNETKTKKEISCNIFIRIIGGISIGWRRLPGYAHPCPPQHRSLKN